MRRSIVACLVVLAGGALSACTGQTYAHQGPLVPSASGVGAAGIARASADQRYEHRDDVSGCSGHEEPGAYRFERCWDWWVVKNDNDPKHDYWILTDTARCRPQEGRRIRRCEMVTRRSTSGPALELTNFLPDTTLEGRCAPLKLETPGLDLNEPVCDKTAPIALSTDDAGSGVQWESTGSEPDQGSLAAMKSVRVPAGRTPRMTASFAVDVE